ncbi:MAG: PEP/pyruvate-binding domain-containing protein [Acidimicrobiia bacterium]
MTGPLVHHLDDDHGDRPAEELRERLGGKGATIVALHRLGLPVPPASTLTTEACRRFLADGWDDDLDAALRGALARLEGLTGRRLGDAADPLLVSVRSGASASMPGMMDSVLDVGATPEVIEALAARTGDRAFADDTWRRARRGWEAVVGGALPADPHEQLVRAVQAVFGSWRAERVARFRELEGLDDDGGTAATVQVMVFGNRSTGSGTGVAFSRDPSTGEPGPMGDFLVGAQGDDVVAGARITGDLHRLRELWPDVWDELVDAIDRVEHHLGDAVDVELTVEDGRLWLLQARPARRSPRAALRVAVDLAEDPTFALDRAGAVDRCRELLDADPATWTSGLGDTAGGAVVVEGLGASPGCAVGVLCVDLDRAAELLAEGADVVLVRNETAPADVPAMAGAVGLVTAHGGVVSHAAVVARDWGVPAVVGAAELRFVDGGVEGPGGFVAEGAVVTVDGDGGRLLRGAHPAAPGEPPPELEVLRRWAAELAGR